MPEKRIIRQRSAGRRRERWKDEALPAFRAVFPAACTNISACVQNVCRRPPADDTTCAMVSTRRLTQLNLLSAGSPCQPYRGGLASCDCQYGQQLQHIAEFFSASSQETELQRRPRRLCVLADQLPAWPLLPQLDFSDVSEYGQTFPAVRLLSP